MFHYDFRPRGVCSQAIHIDLTDDGSTIEGVTFDGGSRPSASWSRGNLSTKLPAPLRETRAGLVVPPVPTS